ncbi:MAG: type I restriction endonuclease, partial [Treponemataceae bacterium]
MAQYYTEEHFENAVLELFHTTLGYQYVYGPSIERDYASPLYNQMLESSLGAINSHLLPNIRHDAIQDALYTLRNFESGNLIQKNMLFMDYVQNGVPVKFFVDGEEQSNLVYIIDYENIDNNSFVVANQWTVIENSEKRPDIILFINGLPLVVIELKSPSREQADASQAFRQIRNYMKEIPSLFAYNAICVMSDLLTSKAGTITSGEDRFMEWKVIDGAKEFSHAASFDVFFEGMFEKKRLLDIVKNFMCFSKEATLTY